MKSVQLSPRVMKLELFATLVAFSAAVSAEVAPVRPAAGGISHEQLVARLRQTESLDAQRAAEEPQCPDPSIAARKSLLERSDVLAFGGSAALVPKGALLRVPEHLAERIAMQPGSRLMNWLEFQVANRGWVTTVEVTLPQAEGKEPLPESLRQHLESSSNVVVATFEGGPISVLPLRVSETSPATP